MSDVAPIDFATLDLLPYGIIVTDRDGIVLYYNHREEQIAGRAREDVVGRNFFTDIAPCTQVRSFQQRFEQARDMDLAATFDFVFPFPGNLRAVEIALTGFQYGGNRLCMISAAVAMKRLVGAAVVRQIRVVKVNSRHAARNWRTHRSLRGSHASDRMQEETK